MVPVSSHMCASKDRCVNFKSTINIDRPGSPFERYIRVFNDTLRAPHQWPSDWVNSTRVVSRIRTHARTHFLSFGHLLRRRGLSSFCRKTAKGGEETRPDQLIRSCAHTGGRSNVD